MTWTSLRAALVSAILAIACVQRYATLPAPERPLRMWVPSPIRWTEHGPRQIEVVLENAGPRSVLVASPDPGFASAVVYPGPSETPVFRAEESTKPVHADHAIRLGPREQRVVAIDLERVCSTLAPGTYRYEVRYVSPPVVGAGVWTGLVPTQYGTLIVS